jgi:ketosteroid isomerase-like protein
VEFRESPEWPEAGVYRGLDALAGYFGRLMERVDGLHGEIEQAVEGGDRVLAYLRASGHDTATGNPVELRFSAIYTFRNGDGKCLKVEGFLDEQAALTAWRSRL